MRKLSILLCCVCLLCNCESDKAVLPVSIISEFHENFDSLNSLWHFELHNPNRLQLVSENPKASEKAAKITIHPGDEVAGGNRAELVLYPGHKIGQETWLSFSVKVPENFQESQIAVRSRHMIQQFHEMPPENVSWEEFKSFTYRNRRPSVAVNLIIKNNEHYLNLMYGNHIITPMDTIEQQNVGSYKIEKGVWVTLKLHVKWSTNDDGFIEGWINGDEWSNLNGHHRVYGANMTNTTPVNLKLGLYREKEHEHINSLFLDEVILTNGRPI